MRSLLFIILFVSSSVVWAQNRELKVGLSTNQVEVGGRVTLQYVFNGSGGNFVPPGNLSQSFRVLGGPNQSQEMYVNNGKVSSKVSYTYVIAPYKTGKITINAAEIEYEGKIYKSEPITIDVREQSEATKAQKKEQAQREAAQLKDIKNNIFVRVSLSKSKLYQGEQVLIVYKLYSRTRMGYRDMRPPEFQGFYTNDVKIGANNEASRQQLDGIMYDVFTIYKSVLIPQKPGKLEVNPLELDLNVQVKGDKPVQTFFGPRYQMKNVEITIESKSLTFEVLPLPSGAPDSFSGAVGSFKYSVTASPEELQTNEPITFDIKLTGTGNLPLIDAPKLEWPREFEVYEPKLKSKVSNESGKISGRKSWEILAIPRAAGTYTLPSLSFSYFNPQTKKYETISTDEFNFEVAQGPEAVAGNGFPTTNQQDLSRIGTDIRFIHNRPTTFTDMGVIFFRSVWFYAILIGAFLLIILGYFLLKKQAERLSDTIGLRQQRANKMAKRHLKKANALVSSTDTNAFHDSISKALYGYISDKFNMSNAELNKNNIKETLDRKGVSSEGINLFIETLEYCEMARFAPQTAMKPFDLLDRAEKIIIKLENEIK